MNHKAIRAILVLMILTILTSTSAFAEGISDANHSREANYDFAGYGQDFAADPQVFGLVDNSILAINSFDYTGFTNNDSALLSASGVRRFCTANCILVASISLPSGVQVNAIEFDVYDADPAGSISAGLYTCPVGASGCGSIASAASGAADVPGATQLMSVADHTVLNGLNTYASQIVFNGSTTADTSFAGFRVFYKRQISPAPGVASFSDVPTNHPFFGNVEALAASGITGGCGAGKYCPDNFVTRAQMAAFLSRALGLHWDGF